MFMTAADYRESLRQYSPRVYCEGDLVECVADEARFMPGIDAVGVTYDYALEPDYQRSGSRQTNCRINSSEHVSPHSDVWPHKINSDVQPDK